MNMPISTNKREHRFSRTKGCSFIVNVAHTETLVFSFLLDEIGWFKNNRQIYLQYTILHIYVHIYMYIKPPGNISKYRLKVKLMLYHYRFMIFIIIVIIIIIIIIIIISELLILITNASLKTTVHYLFLIFTFFEVCIT